MIAWFAANMGTILVLCVLLTVVAAIVVSMRHDRKLGKSSCGGHCSACGGHCADCAGGCRG